MATITGANGNTLTTLNAGANDANGVAAALTAQISAGLRNGTLTPVAAGSTLPATSTGLQQITAAGTTTLLPTASGVLIGGTGVAPAARTVFGNGISNQQILADNGALTYVSNGGSGTVVTGDGANTIFTSGLGFNIATGAGNDTIVAASGNNTINAGGGANTIFVGNGADRITLSGATDDRTTWVRLVPAGTNLWVVRLTAPTPDLAGGAEQFQAMADSFVAPYSVRAPPSGKLSAMPWADAPGTGCASASSKRGSARIRRVAG